ncbi:MAG: PKD domain-containing protein [Bacteroidota bacterium]
MKDNKLLMTKRIIILFVLFFSINNYLCLASNTIKFVANKGQWGKNILYRADINNCGSLFIEKNTFSYNFVENIEENCCHHSHEKTSECEHHPDIQGHAFKINFINANPNTIVCGEHKLNEYRNYFIGNDPSKWASNVDVFTQVNYNNIFIGIDLKIYDYNNGLKYDYIVSPGADYNQIKMKYDGVELSLKQGKLYIKTSINEIVEEKPYAYQIINGKNVEVKCNFVLKNNIVSFEFPEGYDKSYKLIIDPSLVFSTYSGTIGGISANASTYDAAGNMYIAGAAFSGGFPVTTGAYNTSPGWSYMIMAISKYSSDGSSQLYATYLGGQTTGITSSSSFGIDYPLSLFVNSNDELVILGTSECTDYPVTAGCYQSSFAGAIDYVISKLSSNGSALLASTYFGGGGREAGYQLTPSDIPASIYIDGSNNIYICGMTEVVVAGGLPTTPGVFQPNPNGAFGTKEGFISKLNNNLNSLIWSSYIGGSDVDFVSDIIVASTGDIYICGSTASTNFPTTGGVINPTFSGDYDGFVAHISSNANSLINSSFLGTTGWDFAKFIQLDEFNNPYILGSTDGSYPTTPGVYSSPNQLNYFIHKISPNLSSTFFSTQIGCQTSIDPFAANELYPTAFGVDYCENIYFTGSTMETGFPLTSDAYETSLKGLYICALQQDATNLIYGSYFGGLMNGGYGAGNGGSHFHAASNCRYNKSGVLFHTECTQASNYPVTPGAYSNKLSYYIDATTGLTMPNNDAASFKFNFAFSVPLDTFDLGPDVTVCSSSYTITASTNAGLNYLWSTGETTSSITVTASGNYSVMVYHTCDTVYDNINITLTPGFTTSSVSSPSNCGNSDGSATVFITAGTAIPWFTYEWSTGVINNSPIVTNTVNSISAGIYTVTVTDFNGCIAIDTVTVNDIGGGTASIAGSSNVSCNGLNDGWAQVNITGGTAPYTYQWNTIPVQTTATATGLSAGTYNATVTDSNGCLSTTSVTINEPTALSTTTSITDAICGFSNGSANVTVSGGTTPYLYIWSNTQTTASITGISSGIYTVTITDGNGCTYIETVNINDIGGGTASIAGSSNVSCNGLNDGWAQVNITGGTAPYTYQWNTIPVQTTATATGLSAGTYNVTVTDSNGCLSTTSVTINEPTALSTTTSVINATCGFSNGSANVTVSGGTLPYSYLWSNTQTTVSITGISSGSYTVTITDGNGCTDVETANINDIGGPTVTITGSTDVNCYGYNNGSATVTATGGTTPYTYQWNTIPVQTAVTSTGLSAGIYNVTVTDNNGCLSTTSVTINEPPALSVTTLTIDANCGLSNGSATVTVSGGTLPYLYLWSNTQTTASITGIISGSYTVTITDGNGCTNVETVNINDLGGGTASIVGSSDVSCNGLNDGWAQVNITGGTAPYTYQWNTIPTQTTATATGLNAGTYNTTVTDSNGCLSISSVTINEPPALLTTTSVIDATCGLSNGSATIAVTGGTPYYTYAWSSGAGTATVTGLNAGAYTVTVTDINGCSVTGTIIINTTNCNIYASDTTICEGETTQVSVTFDFGVPPYTFIWTGGLSASEGPHTVFPITTTDYIVIVTDSNGNIMSDTATVTVIPTPNVFLGNDTNLCVGITSYLLDAGNVGSTYLWNDNSTNQNLTVIQTGIYSVTVTNAEGCISIDSVNICIGIIGTNTTVTNVSCNGENDGAIDLTVTSGFPPYDFVWSNSAITEDISSLNADTYTVTITDSISCVSIINIVLNEPSELLITGTAINLSCYQSGDGSIDISTTGGIPNYTYSWNNFELTEDLSDLEAGIYTVTVTDDNNCTSIEFFSITQPVQITTNITSANILCYGDTNGQIDLSINGGSLPYTYNWSNGAITQGLNNLTSGIYTVTITDINNCTATNSATITGVGQPLEVTLATTNLSCYGDYSASINAEVTGGTPNYTYSWNTGDIAQSISNVQAGNYIVTVIDNNNCTIVESVEITQPEEMYASLPNDFYMCLNNEETISVSATGGVPGYSYLWSTNETTSSISVSPSQTTIYTVTVTDANNCTTTNNITVFAPLPLQIQAFANHESVCPGDPVFLTAAYQGGIGAPYQLYIDGQLSSLPITVYPTNGQTYLLTIQDQCNNEASDTITLYNYPLPPVSFNSDIVKGCQPLEITFNALDDCEGCSCVWNFDDINNVNLSFAHYPIHVFEDEGVYDITYTVTSVHGCSNSLTIENMITVYPVPDAAFIANPEVVSIIKPLIDFSNLTTGTTEYLWNFGDDNYSTYINPDHYYQHIGSYFVELIAVSQNGCKDTVYNTVIIKDEFTFYGPTAFSPDYDGINDIFYVFGNGIDNNNFKLIIYDRWGEPIFESDDIKRGWDGRAKGGNDIVQIGSYAWLCIYNDLNGITHEKSGSVTIVR